MAEISFLNALMGGLLIGAAAALLLLCDGKIAGISGMLGGVVRGELKQNGWRIAFLAGLLCGGALLRAMGRVIFIALPGRSAAALMLAGVLVGIGTQLGSGCTSGHGVCGIGRGSLRSLVATITFMMAGVLTVAVVRHFTGNVF